MQHSRWLRKRSLFATPSKPPLKRKSALRKAGGFLFKNIKRLCTAIGVMFLLSMTISLFTASMIAQKSSSTSLPDKMVIHLPLEGDFADYSVPSPYSFTVRPHFRYFIDALDYAQRDARVKGVLITQGSGASISLAQLQELRATIKRFRAAGKPVWFYAESMDGGLGSYYLASASDEVWLQPVGNLNLPGIRAEMPYARALLDKVGVEPQFLVRKEYKDVFSTFAEEKMNEHTRESLTKMLDDISSVLVPEMADDRKIGEQTFRELVDKGVLTDKEALAAKLIDRLDYFDVLKKEIRIKATGSDDPKNMKFVKLDRYVSDWHQQTNRVPHVSKHGKIALVYISGTIASDDTKSNIGLYGDLGASAADIAKDIEKIAKDDAIKAVVVRIDSPGGSPTASETIRRALVTVQEKGKNVVVSMGGTTASGGYWIASTADYIFAMPTTITGSIGVAGGKFVMQELWRKVGLNWDYVAIGENSGLYSPNSRYTEAGLERMNAIMDSIYGSFIERVAQGRKKTPEEVDKIARGRVWTGKSARELGLVDDWGSLNDALDYAAVLAGMKSRRDATIVEYPKEKTPFEQLIELLEMQSRADKSLSVLAKFSDILTAVRPALSSETFEVREDISLK